MASRALLVLGVLLSMLLLISSQVAARELAEETSKEKENSTNLQNQPEDYNGGGYNRGGGGYNRGGGGYNRGGGGYNRGGGGYNRGGGGYNRGGGGYNRGGGGYNRGGGGYYPPRCYYGCCRSGYYGGCYCCATADEIPEAAYLPDRY